VTAWWSESRCARYFGAHVRPDGYGRWREAGRQIEFFLEYDFGTEPLAKVAGKLADYHRLAHATGLVTPVLLWFPTRERENNARAALATALTDLAAQPAHPGALVPVATTSSLPADPSLSTCTSTGAGAAPDSPAAARWLPLNPGGTAPSAASRGVTGRLRLAQLTAAWPALARPTALIDGSSGPVPRVAGPSRTESTRRTGAANTAAGTRSWPVPAAMPPDPQSPSVGRGPRAMA
jgi:hypothetical protein